MKLSTKATYGLRAMLAIALECDKGAVSIKEIAKKEDISAVYLEQLLNRLRREGLVKSVRGPKGGYILSKSPGDISVGDIVQALEGDISLVECVTTRDGWKGSCRRSKSCAAKTMWAKLAKTISDCLDSVSLNDLVHQSAQNRHAA